MAQKCGFAITTEMSDIHPVMIAYRSSLLSLTKMIIIIRKRKLKKQKQIVSYFPLRDRQFSQVARGLPSS